MKPRKRISTPLASALYRIGAAHLGLPTYHEMLELMHTELGIPGCGSFYDCLRYIKEERERHRAAMANLNSSLELQMRINRDLQGRLGKPPWYQRGVRHPPGA